jgi:hypothetical protein
MQRSILIALVGVVVAAVVYVLTKDVVWTIVPMLLSVGVARTFMRRDPNGR